MMRLQYGGGAVLAIYNTETFRQLFFVGYAT
jgi:hypothetical protein